MSKIKVLQFSIGNRCGGVTQYILKNWEFIDKEKFQFDFVTLSKELDFEKKLTQQECKIHYISCYAEENIEKFKKEMNKVFDEDYDVVHLHTNYWRSFVVEELAMKNRIPKVIVHSHNTMIIDAVNEEKRKESIRTHNMQREKFSTGLATDFCACSQLAADWLFGEQIPRNRIKIMKNAIDVKAFSFDEAIRNEYRKMLGLENCYVLGHIGRFDYQKNHEMLIETFNKACTTIPNARLMLVGVGVLEDYIREKVYKYGLEDKVLFMGKRSDVSSLLQTMDLFLLPSRYEGFGIALLEAQASGVKCLASINVPNEVVITDNIELIDLDANEWAKKVIDYSKGYERVNVDDIITAAGYNIRYQIKELEELYSAQ
jgi:glycosyltransferase involved in cell wall biosynthesis